MLRILANNLSPWWALYFILNHLRHLFLLISINTQLAYQHDTNKRPNAISQQKPDQFNKREEERRLGEIMEN